MKLMLNGKEVTGMGHYVMAGDIKDATAEDSNVLSGKSYYNNNGKRKGSMPNRGGMSAELAAGGSVSIPEGYHNGEGVVRAQDLASQTAGTAAAANIEAGYTAWVNGEMVEGGASVSKVEKGTVPYSSQASLSVPVSGKPKCVVLYDAGYLGTTTAFSGSFEMAVFDVESNFCFGTARWNVSVSAAYASNTMTAEYSGGSVIFTSNRTDNVQFVSGRTYTYLVYY